MMTLANYGLGSSKNKDPHSAKSLSKALQIRNRAELTLKQCLKSHYRIPDEKRNELLLAGKDYYSRVPFEMVIWNKYQIKQCIIDSILILDEKFDPYKAREAFRIVEEMLVNLVSRPWHKEFRRIITYSGQFKLSVSSVLIGIDEIFKAAGFVYDFKTMQLMLPSYKMPQTDDGESVTSVIFDCLIAQVILTDVINVFENCCRKALKEPNPQLLLDSNQYSWIRIYFSKRIHETTDRACSSAHDVLNNVTNYIFNHD